MDVLPAFDLKSRVAVLIDGDSVPHTALSAVEDRAACLGDIAIRRVFGDMVLHRDWAQETAYTATHCAASVGKIRADLALVIAAMDFHHRGLASVFVIASDDRDFDPLVSHIREQGCRAERIGRPAAPQPTETASAPARPRRTTGRDRVIGKVRAMIAGSGEAGYPIQSLGAALHQEGISMTDTPQKSLRAWLTSYPEEFDCDPRGPKARVRLKT